MTRNRLTGLGALVSLLVLAADQGSKYWVLNILDLPQRQSVEILPVLNLTWVENRGITFGLLNGEGRGASLVLAAVALAVVAALAMWLRRAETRLVAIALGAIAGGAVGNVIDRLRHGWVIDFIHAHAGTWQWYVFDVADAAIVCGVAALVIDGVRPRPADRLADGSGPR